MLKLGVTGTDTGVGKTVVTAALLALLQVRGVGRVSGMKPIETGVVPGAPGPDATMLHSASGGEDRIDDVGPLSFPAPLAPLVAAEVAGRRIDLDDLDGAFTRLCDERVAVVVEGAGGLLTPITRSLANVGLFRRWGLDLLIVAANWLGVLNHTQLTVRAALAAGLRVRAVVLNDVPPAAEPLLRETNHRSLERLLPGIPVLRFPRLPHPGALDALVGAAATCELDLALGLDRPVLVSTRL